MSHAEQFEALDAWLSEYQAVWRARPFVQHRLPWEADWTELSTALRARALEQAEADHGDPHRLDLPAPFPALAATSRRLSRLPDWSSSPPPVPLNLSAHIPGRKWQQIQHFAHITSLTLTEPAAKWVDWCAGKGHLGRLLGWRSAAPVMCLERDRQLNHDGAELSRHWQVCAEHVEADVLAPETWGRLAAEQSVVALHACGDLHATLLRQGAAAGCRQLTLSPCCYNRIASPAYEPMSALGRHAAVSLSREDLGLPLQQTVTAGRRVRALRDRSMAWRLAFDLWQREARGVDEYLPTPSRPESALACGMPAFCRDLAAHHKLALPEPENWAVLEAHGWQRLAIARNLELVQALFRRPLEVWLLLDRALYLEEQGYRVRLGQFCPVELTPRNLILLAERAS
ncbi:Methyltransferase domain-containing protein [Halopseudomonas xinjiangensis]|uniref:Methyltransferase domain-containing protein n=1 Tax=Halopseudomonas xinjiangensis TaxID=487184 RepID=A0A1H1YN33_9GAMM|nr:methyltransferase [Halopseudomonas xinjiangensis]SDT22867.1 Methyltransferase domain-containing protein [Halopseudomonas xinjiangensis]